MSNTDPTKSRGRGEVFEDTKRANQNPLIEEQTTQ